MPVLCTDSIQPYPYLRVRLNLGCIRIQVSLPLRKPEKSKEYKSSKGKGGGDRHQAKESARENSKHKGSSSRRDNRDNRDRGSGKTPLKCFLCDGPHMARECPKRNKLSALTEERDEQGRQQENKMGSLQILNAIKAKVEVPKSEKKGRLYVLARVGEQDVRALVNTGATHNFLELNKAEQLGIRYDKGQGWLKAVNSEPKATYGVARGVRVCLGQWSGRLDFSVVPLDDYPIVLGMEFLDKVKAVPIPFADTMCILEEGNTCMVPLSREVALPSKTISAMQLSKGLKKAEPTFVAALKEEQSCKPTELPREIQDM